MKKFNLFMTFIIMFMLLTGCSNDKKQSGDIVVNFLNEGDVISTEGFHTYSLQVTNQKGDALTVESVYLYMNMKRMNHPIEGTMKKVDVGYYELDLPLAMAGEWYANVTINANGETFVFEDFTIYGEGPKQMEYMKGFNADNQ